MITLDDLTMFPQNIKHLIGLEADDFMKLSRMVEEKYLEARHQKLSQKKRKRKMGGGRHPAPFTLRLFALLMFFRLHIHQRAVAALVSGSSQSGISKDLRELLPFLLEVLPIPQLWVPASEEKELSVSEYLSEKELPRREAIVDVMEQPVYRSKDKEKQRRDYSGKKKKHTVKTQFVIDMERQIQSVSSAFPGRTHDKKMAEKLDTTWRLPDGSELLGDKGYQGLKNEVEEIEVELMGEGSVAVPRIDVVTPHKKPKGKELSYKKVMQNKRISSQRMRIEHVIGWVKNFKICAERFRCHHSIYSSVLRIVAGFVNLATQKRREKHIKTNAYIHSLF